MNKQIRKEIYCLAAQGHNVGANFLGGRCGVGDSKRLESLRMAERAACFVEQLLSVLCAGRERSRLWSVNKAHELGKHKPRRHDFQRVVVKLGFRTRNVK